MPAIPREPHPLITRLAAERKSRGLTQADITAQSGISGPQVSFLETGYRNPTLDTLSRYAAALGYDVTVTRREAP